MSNLATLRQRVTALHDEARSIISAPTGSDGELSTEQQARLEEIKPMAEQLRNNIGLLEGFEEAERRSGRRQHDGIEPGDELDTEVRSRYSLVRAIAGASGLDVDDGYEQEVSQELARREGKVPKGIMVPLSALSRRVRRNELERRVLTSTGDAADLISTDHLGNQFIDILRPKMVVGRAGARTLSGLIGNVDIPRLATSVPGGWRAENTAFPESDHVFDDVSLNPKHVGMITELSLNVLRQSSPEIEQLVRSDFARTLAEQIDSVAIWGGEANEPTGVLATSGIGDVDMSAAPTWSKVIELQEIVESANGDVESGGFVMTPGVKKLLRETPMQASGVEGSFIMTRPNELAGAPAFATTLALSSGSPTTAPLVFGDWSDVLIGLWSGVDILVNPYESTAYSKGNVKIRGIITADVGIRHAGSFAAAQDVGGAIS